MVWGGSQHDDLCATLQVGFPSPGITEDCYPPPGTLAGSVVMLLSSSALSPTAGAGVVLYLLLSETFFPLREEETVYA